MRSSLHTSRPAPADHPRGAVRVRTRPYSISRRNSRASRSRVRIFALRSSSFFVKAPCLRALVLPRGAPEPFAPPCIRHRLLPATAGERQGAPERVRAPQRGLLSMGTVFRLWVLAIAIKMYACFILLLCVAVEPARRNVAEFLSACCAIVQRPRNMFGPIVLQAGKKPVRIID